MTGDYRLLVEIAALMVESAAPSRLRQRLRFFSRGLPAPVDGGFANPSHWRQHHLTPAGGDSVAMTSRTVTVLTFAAAVVFALVLRGGAAIGIALLFLVFVPLEKLFALRQQRVFRAGLLTDLTHILVNSVVDRGRRSVVLVVVAAIPVFWIRRFDLVGALPGRGRGRARRGAGRSSATTGATASPTGAVPVAVPLRAPQHRADGLGRVRPPAPARPGLHPGVHDLPAVPARLRRRRVRRGRGVHHPARAVPARQRAVAVPRRCAG